MSPFRTDFEEAYVPEPKLSGYLLAIDRASGRSKVLFLNNLLGVTSVWPGNAVRPVGDKEIAHVRHVA